MSSKEILEKLKTFLSKEDKKVELETAEIKDADVVIEAESFDVGNEVFVIADDERVPLPVGEYELTDGNMLVVEEEGIIASYGQTSNEPQEEEVVEEEQEMESEEKANPKKVVESVSKEIHFSDDQKAELKEIFNTWYAELQKVEDVEEVVIENKKEEVELSEDSVPAGKAIKHSPEYNVDKKIQTTLSKKRSLSTIDRIFARQLERI